ncbi:hypothetical protein SIN01_22940 [Sporolactobacillus inulinus]|nr:hypothetical protein SIN01_22940 [Sporolactobacillus inulinus]
MFNSYYDYSMEGKREESLIKLTDKPPKLVDKIRKLPDKPLKLTDKPPKLVDKIRKLPDKPPKLTDKPFIWKISSSVRS